MGWNNPPVGEKVSRPPVGSLAEAEGFDLSADVFGGGHGGTIVVVGDDEAVGRHARREGGERFDDLLKAGVIVEMVFFDVENGRQGGGEVEEGAVELARFDDEVFSCSDAGGAVQLVDDGADDVRRIETGLAEDVSGHGGGGAFAIAARDTDDRSRAMFEEEIDLGRLGDAQFVGQLPPGRMFGDGRVDDEQVGVAEVFLAMFT